MWYLANININVLFLFFLHWNFFKRSYILKDVDKTSLILFFGFSQQRSNNFLNQSRIHKLWFGFEKLYFLLVLFQNGKTEYNYFNFISILSKPFLLIVKSNLTYLLSKFSTIHWNIVKRYTKVFYLYYNICRCTSISNLWTFGLSNQLAGIFAPATE